MTEVDTTAGTCSLFLDAVSVPGLESTLSSLLLPRRFHRLCRPMTARLLITGKLVYLEKFA